MSITYPNGRRTSMGGTLAAVNLPSVVSSATYNANNQLMAWGSTTLTYDVNGNLMNDGATTYTWDTRNRLSAFGTTAFAYDSSGRRTRNATGTAFLYDGVNAVQELSGSTVTANLLTGGVDEIFTRTDSAGARNFLTDALGSTLALTDSAGAVQTQYSYEPFGKTTSSGASNTNTFQYTGRENDGTGMYYYRARYYDPTLQRFISEDPLEFRGGGTNYYAYAADNPSMYTDPLGQAGVTSWSLGNLFNNFLPNNSPFSPGRKPAGPGGPDAPTNPISPKYRDALIETAVGALTSTALTAAIIYIGPELWAVEEGGLGGIVEFIHVSSGVGSALAAPYSILIDGGIRATNSCL
jgi:RHS repeat-associated protein